MFVPLSPNLTCLALSRGQFSCSEMYMCFQGSQAASWFVEGSSAPCVLCYSVAWLVHSHEWRMTLVWGFVFLMVGKTWLGKCVAQIMSPISWRAICGVCHSQTSSGARGQSCTQSLNNKVVVVFPWASVWSFPELLSEVSSLPPVSTTFCSFSVRNSVREQHQAAWQIAGNGQEAFLKFLPSLKRKTGPSDSLWKGSKNWPLWRWGVGGGAVCGDILLAKKLLNSFNSKSYVMKNTISYSSIFHTIQGLEERDQYNILAKL